MRILFLSTWFPYPLSQGSKIRAYYLLRALARRHDVTLISFADTAIEPRALEHIEKFCRVEIVRRDPFAASQIRRWLGWLSLQPSSVWATYSPEMASRVRQVASECDPHSVLALTSATARYALQITGVPRIVDVDNFMTRLLREQYASTIGVSRSRQWLAWQKFRRYERWLYNQFDLSLVVSEQDGQDLMGLTRMPSEKIRVVPNGVDVVFNSAASGEPEPSTLVFNGALTYYPNYEAIEYFLKKIFPLILARIPQAKLCITGKTDGVRLGRLQLSKNVTFTGYLDDVRPAVTVSSACIVPIQSGGGTRLKILQAMALGTPVVSTSKGAEGLEVQDEEHLLIANTPAEFAAQTIRLLQDSSLAHRLTHNARRLVEQKYDCNQIGQEFCSLVEQLERRKPERVGR